MKNNKGFTLIEILVVLVIIGIIGAITLPSFASLLSENANNTCFSSSDKLKRKIDSTLILENPTDINKAIEKIVTLYGGNSFQVITPNKEMTCQGICDDGIYTIVVGSDNKATVTCLVHQSK